MRKYFNLVLFLFLTSTTIAQTPQTLNSADILLGLKKLKVIGSVLYVAAHPDDENTRLLAYLSKERLYRTGYLSMTRGDGGQNLIGNEQGIELGMIRTQELLAARRMDGAEQFFTRAYDFGFSKTTDEALKVWEKEKILSDVVWVIRKFQPDVIMTRFPPDNRAGHGHHSASAVLAREAFDAAADPNRFPEQFKYGVKPWRAKRIMWNTFNFGTTNTTSNDQLKIDVGVYNPLLGKGYGEIASESRSQHKSQGFGVPRQRGQQIEFFTLTGGDSMKNDFAEGIVTDWSRYVGGAAINQLIDAIVANYSFQNPSASVKSLIDLYKSISNIKDGEWKNKKLEEVKNLIEACAGLYLEAVSTEQFAVQGDSLHVNIFLSNRSDVKTSPLAIMLNNKQTSSLKSNAALVKNALLRERINFVVPANQPISQPYWLTNTNPKGSFTVNDQLLIGKAESDAAFTAIFSLNIEGETFVFEKPVMYKFTDPVKGEIYWPLVVIPNSELIITPEVSITPNYVGVIKANTNLRSLKIYNSVEKFDSIKINYTPMLKNESRIFNDTTFVPPLLVDDNGRVQNNISSFQFFDSSGAKYNYSKTISYDHIPQITYFQNSSFTYSIVGDFKIASKKIGYINGAGDKVAEGLMQMGYKVTFLEEKDITVANLKQYDAVVTGIRAYNVHPWLNNAYDVLMRYVKEGGVMLVQYNTSNQLGTIKAKMSPYPFNISRNRVTEEDAKVSFLAPTHPVLNYPNKITEKDFEGWVQERSVYEADAIDSNFVSILGMHDEGEPQRSGSLIVANYGKGRFVYSAVAFFRQLPAAVPGAYRLMANLLAKPK